MKRNLWIGLIILVAQVGPPARGQFNETYEQKLIDSASATKQTIEVDPSKLGSISTAVGYHYTSEPPWPDGNCLAFTGNKAGTVLDKLASLPDGCWRVANMHAENFGRFIKSHKITELKLMLLSNHMCMIIDERIPREWLRDKPCELCFSPAERKDLMTRLPEYFRNGSSSDRK